MKPVKNKQAEIRKVAAFRAKQAAGGFHPEAISQKRKQPMDIGQSSKNTHARRPPLARWSLPI